MKCPECRSSHVVKCGFKMTRSGRKQRLTCQNCGRSFYGVEPKTDSKKGSRA